MDATMPNQPRLVTRHHAADDTFQRVAMLTIELDSLTLHTRDTPDSLTSEYEDAVNHASEYADVYTSWFEPEA